MDKDKLADFERLMGEPGPREEEFFALRRTLQMGAGLDPDGHIVIGGGHAFVAFKASILSSKARPLEVGVAWWETDKIIVHSVLIDPTLEPQRAGASNEAREDNGTSWPSQCTQSAVGVATWWSKIVGRRALVSDTPEIGRPWLSGLLGKRTLIIHDFDELAWRAFSDEGCFNAGQLGAVNAALSERKADQQAGEYAAALCQAWQIGQQARRTAHF